MQYLIETLFTIGFGISLLSLLAGFLTAPRTRSGSRGLLDLFILGIQGSLCLALSGTLLLSPSTLPPALPAGSPIALEFPPTAAFLALSLLAVVLVLVICRIHFFVGLETALFLLDVMPGHQMAIDADLSCGCITIDQAHSRRYQLQADCNFFNSLELGKQRHRLMVLAGAAVFSLALLGVSLQKAWGSLSPNTCHMSESLLSATGAFLMFLLPLLVNGFSMLIQAVSGRKYLEMGWSFLSLSLYLLSVFALVALIRRTIDLPCLWFVFWASLLLFISLTPFLYHFAQQQFALRRPSKQYLLGDKPSPLQTIRVRIEFHPELGQLLFEGDSTCPSHQIKCAFRRCEIQFGILVGHLDLRANAQLPIGAYSISVEGKPPEQFTVRSGQLLAIFPGDVEPPFSVNRIQEPIWHYPAFWILPGQKGETEFANCTLLSPGECIAYHLEHIISGTSPQSEKG